ncbi:HNH endonuclease [Pedobacter sp. MR2016-19]|nr:HNH endonuclease [Pedobacter sp. MR2016-19]
MLFSHSIDKSKWENYRMTSKNYLEYVFPQIQKEENRPILFIDPGEEEIFSMNLNMNLNAEIKNRYPFGDDFGNLVLLSPGMNSQYSNKPYPEKRAQFISKPYVDSLKSDLIFKHEGWAWKKAVAHRNEIIHLFQQSLT